MRNIPLAKSARQGNLPTPSSKSSLFCTFAGVIFYISTQKTKDCETETTLKSGVFLVH